MNYERLLTTTVGFDNILRTLDQLSANTELRTTGYPPYNIKRLGKDSDARYVIELAVAGFTADEIDIEQQEQRLKITGRNTLGKLTEDGIDIQYVHRGIAERDFERVFTLAEHVEVESAELVNGLLKVTLLRNLPEEKKPKKIIIGGAKKDAKLLTE